jgi:hypothetical protein
MPVVHDVKLRIFSSTVPTIVNPKGVFTRPGLHDFLSAISKFAANVIIWSSMKRSTIVNIVDYIFHGLPKPLHILGQDSCVKIETSPGNYLKVRGGSKEIFLKILSKTLFFWSLGVRCVQQQ